MNPETIRALQDALTPLADKLGQSVAQLFQIYTRQMVIEGTTSLILSLACMVLSVLVVRATMRSIRPYIESYEKHREAAKESGVAIDDDERPVAEVLTSLVVIFACGLALIWGAFALRDSVLLIANPEYHAIQRIVETVRGTND
jgi:hypothetical protein